MVNPNFIPFMSTNDIWRDLDQSRCLTDDLDAIESDMAALEASKADNEHTHNGYALTIHEHPLYADLDHNHDTVYAPINHVHDYYELSHTHDEYAAASHIHAINDITGLSNELASKYEKPSTGIVKTDLSSDVQIALNKAETAVQSLNGYATETFVNNKVSSIVDSSPEALNTLNELAVALGNDPNFATTIATQIGGKVDKIDGKELSSNDYTDAEKTKLAGIASGANKTVVDSALSSTSTNPVQNKVVNTAINNLNTLIGDKAVSTQINNALVNVKLTVNSNGVLILSV